MLNGTALVDSTYTRAATGRIASIQSPLAGESWSYSYDGFDRLTSATNLDDPSLSQSFSYQPGGNMASNSRVGAYAYPAPGAASVRPHAPLTAGTFAFTYDGNGQGGSRPGKTRWRVSRCAMFHQRHTLPSSKVIQRS